MAGIYAIANIDTAKIYIGSSSDVKNRILQHKNLLKKGKEVKSLQHDYDDGAAFAFFQLFDLKDCCQEKQYFYEQCHIMAFKQSSLYNKSRGVIRAGYKKAFLPHEVRERIKKSLHPFITTDAIASLCGALHCQPGDILEYIPEPDTEE